MVSKAGQELCNNLSNPLCELQGLSTSPSQIGQNRFSHQAILNTVNEQSAHPSGNNGVQLFRIVVAESHEVSIQSSNTLQSQANVSRRSKFQQLLWRIISTGPTIDQWCVNLERKAGLDTNITMIHSPQQTVVWESKPQNLSCFPTSQDGDMLNHLEVLSISPLSVHR